MTDLTFVATAIRTPAPARAFWGDQTCELVTYHAPEPVMVEYHHQKPVFLQNTLYGKVIYGPSLWVCSNCHDAVHAWLYYLLGEHRAPARIGYAARREAERTFAWFNSEKERLGL